MRCPISFQVGGCQNSGPFLGFRVILGLYIRVYIGIMENKMEATIMGYMSYSLNYGPFLGTLNTRCRIIIGTQKGTIILPTTQVWV